jgi:hypothetical protein
VKSLGQFLRMVLVNIRIFALNPRCPWCGQHTPAIEDHYRVDHAGDEWLMR